MSYINKILVKGKSVKSDTLVLMIHTKTDGEDLPEHMIHGYFSPNVYYKREKKFNVVFAILNKAEDQIIYSKDIMDIIDEVRDEYKNIKILTYSRDIYSAVIKAQDTLKLYKNDKFKPLNLTFEYIGRSIHSEYEFAIPSTIFFLYEREPKKVIEEFCDRAYHVYGCEGYRNAEDELVPYMNDYARYEAIKRDFKYTFMGGTWTYRYTKNEDEAIYIDDLPVIITEEYALNSLWKLQEFKHLNPMKWNGVKSEVMENDVEENSNE